MSRCNVRDILYFQAQVAGSLAEIHIFKPNGIELCVKTAQPLPHLAPKHQERARRLLYFCALRKVHVETSVGSVERVPRDHPVDAEDLEAQRRRSGKTAQRKATLRLTVLIGKLARR
jgi:hypothetical protein